MKKDDNSTIYDILISQKRRRRRGDIALRMAPMIDVIFLLLTFFVLTARFRIPEEFLPVKLPASQQIESYSAIEPLGIEITQQQGACVIHLDKVNSVTIPETAKERALSELAGKYTEILKAQKRRPQDPVEIYCQNDVKWDDLLKIYNLLYGMGTTDITFNINE